MKINYKKNAKRLWKEWIQPVLAVLIVLGCFRSAVADWNDVPTGSMKPTILEGDRIFVNKLAYDLKVPFTKWRLVQWSQPQRGDVVILFSPRDGSRLVKRVVGIPGDTVELSQNALMINGEAVSYEKLDQSFVKAIPPQERPKHAFAKETLGGRGHPVMLTPRLLAPKSFGPVTLGVDQFFVMGDNRDQSSDSRFFGLVDRSLIVGEVTAVVLSFDRENYFAPRWSRFFTSMP